MRGPHAAEIPPSGDRRGGHSYRPRGGQLSRLRPGGKGAVTGSRLVSLPHATGCGLLDCSTYETALQRCRDLTDTGISKQAFALRNKILEVDAHAVDPRVHEVHPEVSFLEMNDQQRLPRKKSWAGMTARRTLLARNGIDLPDDLGPAGAVPPDDILDAAAAAWSAACITRGVATRLPTEDSQQDRRGRPIAIWA